ncbi:hypothetical protein B0H14DRAFT_3124325 [Mycena olivaceomarginata]|nr:hypothetical protein B0H14DRAFT_3124325 [Mycena olivaceomarginata]
MFRSSVYLSDGNVPVIMIITPARWAKSSGGRRHYPAVPAILPSCIESQSGQKSESPFHLATGSLTCLAVEALPDLVAGATVADRHRADGVGECERSVASVALRFSRGLNTSWRLMQPLSITERSDGRDAMGGGLLQRVDALRVGAPVVDAGADIESLRRHTGVGDVHATTVDVVAVVAEAKARLRERTDSGKLKRSWGNQAPEPTTPRKL